MVIFKNLVLCAALSSVSLVVIGAMDINTDLGCSRAMDPDTTLGNFPSLDNTMTPRW